MASLPIFKRRSPRQRSLKGSRFIRQPLPDRRILKEEAVKEQLRYIYQDSSGRVRDLSRLEKGSGGSWKWAIVIVLFLAVLGAAGWYGYRSQGWGVLSRFGEEQVELSIDAPENVAVGKSFPITVRAFNRGTQTLNGLDLLVQLPKGFIVERMSPAAADQGNRRWNLGTLARSSAAEVTVQGTLWAVVPATLIARASLVFTPESLRASFRSTAEAQIQATESLLAVGITAPDTLSLGEKGQWKIALESKAEIPTGPFELHVAPPSQFLPESSAPQAEMVSGLVWKGLGVEPNKPTVVSFEGVFLDVNAAGNENSSSKEFRVRLFFGKDASKELLSEHVVNAVVNQSAFFVRLNVNDSSSGVTLQPPAEARVAVEVVNRGVDPATGVSIAMNLASSNQVADLVDLAAIAAVANPPTVDGTRLGWTKENAGSLGFLRGGGTVRLEFSLPVKPHASGALNLSAVASYAHGSEVTTVQSNTVNVSLSPLLDGSVESRWFNEDNIAFGKGPLPPRSGSRTTVSLLATITKRSGSYRSLEFSIPLAEGIEFEQSSSQAGSLALDASARTIRWKIPLFPETISSVSADIRVAVLPRESDISKVLPLVKMSGMLTAQDAASGARIERQLKLEATTNLEGDSQVSGRGAVVGR